MRRVCVAVLLLRLLQLRIQSVIHALHGCLLLERSNSIAGRHPRHLLPLLLLLLLLLLPGPPTQPLPIAPVLLLDLDARLACQVLLLLFVVDHAHVVAVAAVDVAVVREWRPVVGGADFAVIVVGFVV